VARIGNVTRGEKRNAGGKSDVGNYGGFSCGDGGQRRLKGCSGSEGGGGG